MSFKAGKYLSKRYQSKSSRQFVTKGTSSDDLLLSEEQLLEIIQNLRNNEYVPIKRLHGSLKTDFETLSKYISLIHQTNSYPLLKDMINNEFSKIENVTPGTIGSFFYGSSVNVNMDPQECSALHAGSIPNDDSEWNKCKNTVILANQSSNGYDFSLLNMGDDKSHAYIHVNHQDFNEFNGFSKMEKNKLKKYGVEYVYLYGYGDETSHQKDLIGSAVHIDELKCRQDKHQSSSGISWIFLLILVIFIVILLVALFGNSKESELVY